MMHDQVHHVCFKYPWCPLAYNECILIQTLLLGAIDHLLHTAAGCAEAVALTQDGRPGATSNGILSPSIVVIIEDVEVAVTTPYHMIT